MPFPVFPLFHITGSVEVRYLYGEITTALGSNVTAAHFRLNDQTATDVVITAAAGTTLSSAPAGSLILANVLAATALTLKTAAVGAMLQPAVVNTSIFSPSVFTQKTGGITTDIEFVYTTNNTSLGVIKFYAKWIPLTENGNLEAV